MYKHATKKHRNHSEYDLVGDIERIKSAIYDTAYDVKGRAGEVLNQSLMSAKERSIDLRDSLGDYAKEKPFRTVGLAMLGGIIIGFFLNRK